jgi:hypothetical protein
MMPLLKESELAHDYEHANHDRGHAQDMLSARRERQDVDNIQDRDQQKEDGQHCKERMHPLGLPECLRRSGSRKEGAAPTVFLLIGKQPAF